MSTRLSWAPDSSERAADVSSKEPSESTTVTVGDAPFGLGFFWMMRSMSSWYFGHVALLLGVGAVADAVLDVHARHERGLFHAVGAIRVEDDRAILARVVVRRAGGREAGHAAQARRHVLALRLCQQRKAEAELHRWRRFAGVTPLFKGFGCKCSLQGRFPAGLLR